MFTKVRIAMWRYRLRLARQYRSGLEQVFAAERVRAEHDVHHCETMLARAEMAVVQRRADKELAEELAARAR